MSAVLVCAGVSAEPEDAVAGERMPHRVTADATGELSSTTVAWNSGVKYMRSGLEMGRVIQGKRLRAVSTEE